MSASNAQKIRPGFQVSIQFGRHGVAPAVDAKTVAPFGVWLSAKAESASSALSVRKSVSGRWFAAWIQKAPCAFQDIGSFGHGLEGLLVWTGSCSEDFGAGGSAGCVGASEDGVLALVGVEDSASLACVEDLGRGFRGAWRGVVGRLASVVRWGLAFGWAAAA